MFEAENAVDAFRRLTVESQTKRVREIPQLVRSLPLGRGERQRGKPDCEDGRGGPCGGSDEVAKLNDAFMRPSHFGLSFTQFIRVSSAYRRSFGIQDWRFYRFNL
jgi:hypothetical protein